MHSRPPRSCFVLGFDPEGPAWWVLWSQYGNMVAQLRPTTRACDEVRSVHSSYFCCVHWTNWQVMKVGAALALLVYSVTIFRSSFRATVRKTDLFLLLLWTLLECCSFFLSPCVALPGSAWDIHRSILSRAHLSPCLSSFIARLPHSVIQFPFWAYYAEISPCLVGSPSFIVLIFHFYLSRSLERTH